MAKTTYIVNGLKFKSFTEVEQYANTRGSWVSEMSGEQKRNGDWITKVTLSKLI